MRDIRSVGEVSVRTLARAVSWKGASAGSRSLSAQEKRMMQLAANGQAGSGEPGIVGKEARKSLDWCMLGARLRQVVELAVAEHLEQEGAQTLSANATDGVLSRRLAR